MFDEPPKYSPEAEATIEAIVRRAREIAGCATLAGDHGKSELVTAVKHELAIGWRDDRLAITQSDMCVFDMRVAEGVADLHGDDGVADLVVVHADSTVTVIALRNGDKGLEHVGRGMRAVLAIAGPVGAKCLAPSTRKALLWSSCGDPTDDAILGVLCERAGIIPLSWPSLAVQAAASAMVLDAFGGRTV